MAPDLPHLFARLSELVHAAGYAPEDLVLIPRSEIDRRETAAFTAGWAEAMSEELPRIRREYEKRVADAYAAGGGGRGGDPAARRTSGEGRGAKVIRLPFATLLEPSPLVVETEDRMRRAQEILDRRTEPVHGQAADPDADPETDPAAGQPRPHEDEPEDPRQAQPAQEPREPREPREPQAPQEPAGPEGPAEPAPPPARPPARERRAAPASRKVVRRNGRPIVPPLGSIPVQPRPQGTPAEHPADGPGAAGEPGEQGTQGAQGAPSLADRARALAQDMETRVGVGRPESPENGR
ncbi:hypothetical protein [Streptomyces sp. NPDC048357]|uniref:hypothetical protein n=1 Tax=Streptomyces sp. NPDC048357 TaxID=3154719 RepID=UPI0034482555